MKGFISISVGLFASIIVTGQWIEIGDEQMAEYPFGLCQDENGNVLAAVSAIHVPDEPTAELPYLTSIYRFSEGSGDLDTVQIADFIAESLFSWNTATYLFGSGQTSSGIYSIGLYQIDSNFESQQVYSYSTADTSIVARASYVDQEGNLIVLARRFYNNGEDFLACKFSTTGELVVLTTHDGPDSASEFNFTELADTPGYYLITASNGMNFLLEKEQLSTLQFYNTQLLSMNLLHEASPIALNDSSYLICGDNFSVDGFGNLSAYIVSRNVVGETINWFEVYSGTVEYTNQSCGFILDDETQELFIGITATSGPFNNLVPVSSFGIVRYTIDGNMISSSLNGADGQYYSNRAMIRLNSGQFVTAGITSPAGIEPNENELDVFFAFYNEEGTLLNLYTQPPVREASITSLGENDFRLELGDKSKAVCEIYDLTGKKLYCKRVYDDEVIHFQSSSAGIYMFRLVDNGRMLLSKKFFCASAN